MDKPFTIKRILDSTVTVIDTLCLEVRHEMERRRLSDDIFSIEMLIREAMTNAIVHGNQNDPSKKIFFSLQITPGLIEFSIEDQGPGFDWKKKPKHIDEDDGSELREHGMGLIIYSTYATSFDFNEQGNCVTFLKKVAPGSDSGTVSIHKHDGTMRVMLNGPLIYGTHTSIREQVLQELDSTHKNVLLDIENVSIIDSRGIAFLVSLHKIITGSGGTLTIINISSNLQGLLESVHLDRYISLKRKTE